MRSILYKSGAALLGALLSANAFALDPTPGAGFMGLGGMSTTGLVLGGLAIAGIVGAVVAVNDNDNSSS